MIIVSIFMRFFVIKSNAVQSVFGLMERVRNYLQ